MTSATRERSRRRKTRIEIDSFPHDGSRWQAVSSSVTHWACNITFATMTGSSRDREKSQVEIIWWCNRAPRRCDSGARESHYFEHVLPVVMEFVAFKVNCFLRTADSNGDRATAVVAEGEDPAGSCKFPRSRYLSRRCALNLDPNPLNPFK